MSIWYPQESFQNLLKSAFRFQIKIVMACCALHNWILQDGPDEYVYDDAT